MELVREIVDLGITVSLFVHDGKFVGDLSFNTVSHGYLHELEDGSLVILGRYSMVEPVSNLEDCVRCYERFKMSKDYGNSMWDGLLLSTKRRYVELNRDIHETSVRTMSELVDAGLATHEELSVVLSLQAEFEREVQGLTS